VSAEEIIRTVVFSLITLPVVVGLFGVWMIAMKLLVVALINTWRDL
jgi:hypothetical protein